MDQGRLDRISHWARRYLVLGLLCIVAVVAVGGAGIWILNRGPVPERFRDLIVTQLREELQAEVDVGSVWITSLDRMVLQDVVVAPSVDPALQEASPDRQAVPLALDVERLTIGFRLGKLWEYRQDPLQAVSWLTFEGPRLTLPLVADPRGGVGETMAVEQAFWQVVHDLTSGRGLGSTGQLPDDAALALPADAADDAAAPQIFAGRPWDGLDLTIHLTDGSVALPGTSQSLQLVSGISGLLEWSDAGLELRDVVAHIPGGKVEVGGSVVGGNLQGTVSAVEWDPTSLWTWLPGARTMTTHGTVNGDFAISGTLTDPTLRGELSAAPLTLDVPGIARRPYRFEQAHAQVAWQDGLWELQDLQALRGETRVQGSGTLVSPAGMDLQVAADHLLLPDDLAVLQEWGVTGTADFSGRLTVQDNVPVLAGAVTMGLGELWQQPTRSLNSSITLTPGRLAFEDTHISQDAGYYGLAGHVVFADDNDPGSLDIRLDTESGQARALLEVIGWEAPLRGWVDGYLHFVGPFGAISSSGQVSIAHGEGWDQPFDELAGSYQWEDGGLEIQDGRLILGNGQVAFAGVATAEGELDFTVDAADVPTYRLPSLERVVGDTLFGELGFAGRVTGRADHPRVEGELSSGHLEVAGVDFHTLQGDLRLSGDVLRSEQLTLQRPSGGIYRVRGAVGDLGGRPVLDLTTEVERESLVEVVGLTGWRLPVAAAQGTVAVEADVSGYLDDPVARVRLGLQEGLIIGRETGLSLDIHVADGRISVYHLETGRDAGRFGPGEGEQGPGR